MLLLIIHTKFGANMEFSLIVMWGFIALLTTPSTPAPLLPCDLPLRIVVPALFTHCPAVCAYSKWTSWEKLPGRSQTTKDHCPSGYYFTQQRTRTVIAVAMGNKADCTDRSE